MSPAGGGGGSRRGWLASSTIRAVLELPAGALRVEAPAPEWISQRTSEAVLGVPRRQFLELLRRYPGEVLRVGRLRLVERVAFLAWLRQRQATEAEPERDGVTELAAELGWRLDEAGAEAPAVAGHGSSVPPSTKARQRGAEAQESWPCGAHNMPTLATPEPAEVR